jgi:hypothetical protein
MARNEHMPNARPKDDARAPPRKLRTGPAAPDPAADPPGRELAVDSDMDTPLAPHVGGPPPSEEVDPSGRSALDYGETPSRSYVGQAEEEE